MRKEEFKNSKQDMAGKNVLLWCDNWVDVFIWCARLVFAILNI